MKCFSVLLISLFFALRASCAIYEITPIKQTNIKTGDFLSVRISSSDGAAPAVVGKRIGGVLYVMEQEDDILDVIVAPPSAGKDELSEGEDRYVLKGFQYEHKKNEAIKKYLTEDFQYDFKEGGIGLYLALILLVLALGWPALSFYKKRREKQITLEKRKIRATNCLDSIRRASSRKDYEAALAKKGEVEDLLEFSATDFEAFKRELDGVQYKKEWSEQEKAAVEASFKKWSETLRVKSGV